MQLADVFAWTVDFYRIQKDDKFSVVYNESTVDGERYGTPRSSLRAIISGRTDGGLPVRTGRWHRTVFRCRRSIA
jgi:hypothetical protein